MKRRIFKIIKVVAALELTWLLLANMFLATGLASWALNREPERQTLTWKLAWTVIPARVHARDVVFSRRTRGQETKITADRVTTTIGVVPLLRKTLVLGSLDIETLSVDSSRLPPPDVVRDDAQAKTVPGLRIVFEDIDVETIGKLRIDDLEIAGGESSVEGTFEMQVRGSAEVRDAVLNWQGATVRRGDELVANSLAIAFRGGMLPFDPKIQQGREALRHLFGELDVEGRVTNLRSLEVFFEGAKWIERLDGVGNVALHLLLESGKLRPGSDVDVVAESLELDLLGFEAHGSGRINAEVNDSVADGESGRLGVMTVEFDQFSFGRKGHDLPFAVGSGLTLRVQAPDLGLGEGIHALAATVDLPVSEVPDISFLGELVPPAMGLVVAGGRASLSAHLEVSGENQAITGSLDLAGENLTGSFRDMDFEMDMKLATLISGYDLDDFEVELTGTELRLFDGSFDNERGKLQDGWWMTVSIPEGTANLAEPLEVQADVDLSMRDTRAIVALFAEVKPWARYLEGMLTVRNVEGSVSLSVIERAVSLRDLQLTGDKLQILGELDLDKAKSTGVFWFKYRVLGLAVERLGDASEWKLYKAREWYDAQRAEKWASGR